MGALIKVLDKEIMPVVYNGIPVLSLRQIDELHERQSGTARQAFNRHRDELVEGEDFFDLSHDVWSGLVVTQTDDQKGGHRGNMIFITEYGYPLVVKPFTDKHSWQIQKALRKCYFAVKTAAQPQFAVALPPPCKMVELPDDSCVIKKDMLLDLQQTKIAYLEGRSRVDFTEEEKAYMREARAAGMSNGDIAKALNRNEGSISGWFNRNPCPKGERK